MKTKLANTRKAPLKKAGATRRKKPADPKDREDFRMQFDIGTIKHLGLQMYSSLPPVIGELVANAWDADANRVDIVIPTTPLKKNSEITVTDNGSGMTDSEIRGAYLVVGRDRRKVEGDNLTPKYKRKVIGKKGIGKFSGFGIAGEIEIETVKDSQNSRFRMNYADLETHADRREILMPSLPPSGNVKKGTKVTLRNFTKFKNRSIGIKVLRRGLARRFSVIGSQYKFQIYVNDKAITPTERNLQLLLDKDSDGEPYLWEYENHEIKPDTGWAVSGWIGALDRTNKLEDGIQRGIVIMARGKLVQEPFVFDATVGQQYALSYLVGELIAEFVDTEDDVISTTRNSLVWDVEPNITFKDWGQREVNRIAREWAEKRKRDNEKQLAKNPLYLGFVKEADRFDNQRVKRVADKLIREVVRQNPVGDEASVKPVIEMCLDYMQFDAFQEMAQELTDSEGNDADKLVKLFREWEVVEAKEMMRVTKGRIATIEKLQKLIDENALEVPILHNFLKEFPWVLDPRWTLVADEVTYSKLLREKFPEGPEVKEKDRRIDFLCVKESNNLVVVEIKRPKSKASVTELDQIEGYVNFMREYSSKTSDPELKTRDVVGYLLCGDLVNTWAARGKRDNLAMANIFVRRYSDLLRLVRANHKDFLSRYDELRKVRSKDKKLASSSTGKGKKLRSKKQAAKKR